MKKQRRPNVIMELIARTKQAVRALDNMNYKRMKKILVTDVTSETGDDVSDPGDTSSIDAESNGPRDGVSRVVILALSCIVSFMNIHGTLSHGT